MRPCLRFAAVLCAVLILPIARGRAQDLYVGYTATNETVSFTSGTNRFNWIYVGNSRDDSTDNLLAVSGAGTQLIYTNDLTVSASGNSVVISNGGQVSTFRGAALIGWGTSCVSNSAVITGTNSKWTAALFYVGDFFSANNTLLISNGGSVHAGFSSIGEAGTGNMAVVTGAGSLWATTNHLSVGGTGIIVSGNSLLISNGGSVVNSSGYIGFGSYSELNSVLVTGTNSVWSNSASLNVGAFGFGRNSMVISNGGSVIVGFGGVIGYGTGVSSNSVLVTGTNSLWTNSSSLLVGHYGSGNSMVISNGGTAAGSDGSLGHFDASSNNSALVTGADSLWTNSGAFRVGERGGGNILTISNGGRVAGAYGYVGSFSNSSGNSALVTGTNSLWSTTFQLYVGEQGASNTLTVANGAKVAASDIVIAASKYIIRNAEHRTLRHKRRGWHDQRADHRLRGRHRRAQL